MIGGEFISANGATNAARAVRQLTAEPSKQRTDNNPIGGYRG
jgi:hypothetical protein